MSIEMCVKEAMKREKMKVETLASSLGISRQAVNARLKSNMGIDKVVQIADILGYKVALYKPGEKAIIID